MAKTGHPNGAWVFSTEHLAGEKEWTLSLNHSGGSFNAADAATFMESVFTNVWDHIVCGLADASTNVTRVAAYHYYDGINSAPVYSHVFPAFGASPKIPGGLAWGAGTNYFTGNLASCALLQVQCGANSDNNKPVYLRKWVRSIPPQWDRTGRFGSGIISEIAPYAANLTNGTLYDSRVICSPNGRQAKSGSAMALDENLVWHQLNRGRRRGSRATNQSNGVLAATLEKLLEGGIIGLATDL